MGLVLLASGDSAFPPESIPSPAGGGSATVAPCGTGGAERKAKLDSGWIDVKFTPGDLVLVRSKELLDAAEIGKLRDRWEGPFKVIKEAAPNAYLLKVAKRPHGECGSSTPVRSASGSAGTAGTDPRGSARRLRG